MLIEICSRYRENIHQKEKENITKYCAYALRVQLLRIIIKELSQLFVNLRRTYNLMFGQFLFAECKLFD